MLLMTHSQTPVDGVELALICHGNFIPDEQMGGFRLLRQETLGTHGTGGVIAQSVHRNGERRVRRPPIVESEGGDSTDGDGQRRPTSQTARVQKDVEQESLA